MKSRLLICRTDRLGDVLLSLPALVSLKLSAGTKYDVDFLVAEALVPLLKPFLEQHSIRPIPFSATSKTWWNHLTTVNYAGAVAFFHDPLVADALKANRIRVRVGLYSKLNSFFTYNAGKIQRRSRGLKSEADYAQELAHVLADRVGIPTANPKPMELPLRGGPAKRDDAYWVLHPGMGGSAQNLSVDTYAHLARLVMQAKPGLKTVISVGPAAADAQFASLAQVLPDATLIKGLSLPDFSELLRDADLVVAPSTGPLHLAHWVGTETLGLFSNLPSQRATRWAPMGATGKSHVWSCEKDMDAEVKAWDLPALQKVLSA